MKNGKKIGWQRWLLAGISVLVIIGMWVYKTMTGRFAGMSPADALPMIITSFAVTCGKVALMAGVMLALRWIAGKVKG